ncbi:MAG: trypsin-like peptidase domain-containing protein, partial [Verrucomicrobia bacterium]|nr:trypsin-like peptidase domain-containing protein [Verrucomicrobiota bacterium]
NIPNADLHLIRHDGSSFGLFFPLQFRNVLLSENLTAMLELEIQDKWLKGLFNWEKHPLKEGFLLTARGEAKGNGLYYAIFYKHFGNLGVYGIFWSEERHKERLIQEAELFYSNLTADPVKERLERLTPAELYRRSQEAVVLINTYNKEGKLNGKGSGFSISPKGLIVTNLHVLAQGHSVEVVFPGKEPIRDVVVVGMSPPKVDLALLQVTGAPLPALTAFKSVPVAPGDKVYVIGSPKGLVNTVSEGIVGGIRHDGSAQLYQITAPISHGSSGGPVFNEYGEVIGVANAMAVDAQNVNFSISIDELEKMTIFRRPITTEALSEKLVPRKGS